MFDITNPIPYQKINYSQHISLSIKRLDLIHPQISGNKFYKLKHNFLHARAQGYSQVLSFGGAYSNHIVALSAAAKAYGFHSIGVIRGDELASQSLNPSLTIAKNNGMQLEFVSRQQYREKHLADYLAHLQARYPQAWIIPEGGTNALAIQGTNEILSVDDREKYDLIVCAVGTGGTCTGLIQASAKNQTVWGFSALKADFLNSTIQQWTTRTNWQIFPDHHFGGYAKYNAELLHFIQHIYEQHKLPLEPIYTAKAFYALTQLIEQGQVPAHTRILFIHSGGLQAFPELHQSNNRII